MPSTVPDRRPWLILSLKEATALYLAALESIEEVAWDEVDPDLRRALNQVQEQTEWIKGGGGKPPTVVDAIQRSRGALA